MSTDPRQLEAAIRAGDPAQVRELLRDASETDRKSAAEALKPLFDGPVIQFTETFTIGAGGGPISPSLLAQLLAAQEARADFQALRFNPARAVARLGLADGLKKALEVANDTPPLPSANATRGARLTGKPAETLDAIAGVLADRQPPWLGTWAERRLTARFPPGLAAWPIARALVRLGAIRRPDVPQYTTAMVRSLYAAQYSPGDVKILRHPLDSLLADPGLLEDEVWRLFEVPDAANLFGARFRRRYENVMHEQCTGAWLAALATLAERGHLDRDRLLDACLDVFLRDFPPNRVGWYAKLHDRLAPTLGETDARADRYLALLAANAQPGVSLGQRAGGRLLAAGLLPAADFLAASPPALLFPRKAIALAQLKLIGKVAGEPSVRAPALAAAAEAFSHERLDVQEAALDLIGRLGVPDGPEGAVIAGHAQRLSPALIGKAAGFGMLADPPARAVVVPAEIAHALASGDNALPPLEDPAELVRLLTQLMEDASDLLAVERVLGGAVRLATLPSSDRLRLGSPLVRRAEEFLSGLARGGHDLSQWIALLALAWAAVPYEPPAWVSAVSAEYRGILGARTMEARHLVEGGPAGAGLLAEPSAADGSVHPDTLLARLATWRGAPLLRYDMEVALLRLPAVDAPFWAAWERSHPASAEAARQAYAAGTAELALEPAIGTAPSHNAHRQGRPILLARVIGEPPAPAGGSRCWEVLTDLNPLAYRSTGSPVPPAAASWPLLCPWQPELAAAHLLQALSDCLVPGPGRARRGAAAVTGLTRSSAPLGPIGHLALLTGLSSAEAIVRIAAADVWAQAALAGRLDPDLAADALVTGVTGEAVKLTRVADGLRHASGQPAPALTTARAVFASADRLVPARPPNLHLLLELAGEIGAAIALPEPPQSIVALAAEKSPAKLAVAARRLVRP
jgi:hypothetical protein